MVYCLTDKTKNILICECTHNNVFLVRHNYYTATDRRWGYVAFEYSLTTHTNIALCTHNLQWQRNTTAYTSGRKTKGGHTQHAPRYKTKSITLHLRRYRCSEMQTVDGRTCGRGHLIHKQKTDTKHRNGGVKTYIMYGGRWPSSLEKSNFIIGTCGRGRRTAAWLK